MSKLDEEIRKAAKLSTALLTRLSDAEEWSKEDEKVMKRLTKLVALVAKLSALNSAEEEPVVGKSDREIIERYIKRRMDENSGINLAD